MSIPAPHICGSRHYPISNLINSHENSNGSRFLLPLTGPKPGSTVLQLLIFHLNLRTFVFCTYVFIINIFSLTLNYIFVIHFYHS